MPVRIWNALVGRQRRPQVTQRDRARLHREAEVAEGLVEGQPVVRGIGLAETRELVIGGPLEPSGLHYDAAHGRAVAAQELGHGVDHDVGAPLERAAQDWTGERVVDDQGDVMLTGDGGEHLEVDHQPAGVGEALGEDELGAGRDGSADGGLVPGVDQAAVPAEPRERVAELSERAAIQESRGDEVVAGLHQRVERDQLRRVAGRDRHGAAATFQAGDSSLERGHGGVRDAAVDVAERLEVEQRRGVVGVLEDIRRGLEDGHVAGARDRLRRRARVDGPGLDAVSRCVRRIGRRELAHPRIRCRRLEMTSP